MMLHRNKTKKVLGFFFLSSFSRRCWAIKWFHFSPVSPYSVCVLIFFFFWLLSSVELHTRLTVYVANTLENVEKRIFCFVYGSGNFFWFDRSLFPAVSRQEEKLATFSVDFGGNKNKFKWGKTLQWSSRFNSLYLTRTAQGNIRFFFSIYRRVYRRCIVSTRRPKEVKNQRI